MMIRIFGFAAVTSSAIEESTLGQSATFFVTIIIGVIGYNVMRASHNSKMS
jgi:hypothetical protein